MMTSKEALSSIAFSMKYRCSPKYVYKAENDNFAKIEKDLEVLEQLETLKKYYEPFKQFLKEMFEKGHNEDLTKVKEWLENER